MTSGAIGKPQQEREWFHSVTARWAHTPADSHRKQAPFTCTLEHLSAAQAKVKYSEPVMPTVPPPPCSPSPYYLIPETPLCCFLAFMGALKMPTWIFSQ
ncbi:hypothetical protein E2C01_045301 [Portunus trituberculatus]|uniref:Uncharacterized protein n=1 Tax=Portunus trituberculatus TaxID=210409 RepID=A0A5B7G1N6_PORTR|nr:hypothetical protein [Portunus trituberculatus]